MYNNNNNNSIYNNIMVNDDDINNNSQNNTQQQEKEEEKRGLIHRLHIKLYTSYTTDGGNGVGRIRATRLYPLQWCTIGDWRSSI